MIATVIDVALRQLVQVARLRETAAALGALDADAGTRAADELTTATVAFEATRSVLDPPARALVDRARAGLRDGWLDSRTLGRLAEQPDALESWLDTADAVDGL